MGKILDLIILTLIIFGIYYLYEERDVFLDYFSNNNIEEIIQNTGLSDIVKHKEVIDDSETSNLEDSGIKSDSVSLSTETNIYFSYLSREEKILYKQIYANVQNLKTTFVPESDIRESRVGVVIESFLNDHPEMFWLNNEYSYKYNEDGFCKQITLKYNDTVNYIDDINVSLDALVNNLYNATMNMGPFEREKYVHDFLAKKIDYDINAEYNQSIYSSLVGEKSVCAGYAKAFMYIMNKLGNRTYYVTGTADGVSHAWNIIELDGEYYNVDLTWDDQESETIYLFFNSPDDEFSRTHIKSELSYILPEANGNKYTYKNMGLNDRRYESVLKKLYGGTITFPIIRNV